MDSLSRGARWSIRTRQDILGGAVRGAAQILGSTLGNRPSAGWSEQPAPIEAGPWRRGRTMNRDVNYWGRFWKKRVSRRRVLGAAGLAWAGIAAGATVGCAKKEGAPPEGTAGIKTTATAPAVEPVYGGHLRECETYSPTTLDSHMSIAAADLPFFWPMYDSLLTHSPEDSSPAPQRSHAACRAVTGGAVLGAAATG